MANKVCKFAVLHALIPNELIVRIVLNNYNNELQ